MLPRDGPPIALPGRSAGVVPLQETRKVGASQTPAVAFLTAGMLPAVALAGAWFWGDRTVDRATVAPPTTVGGASSTSLPAAPLFSLRRVPNYLATEAAAGLVGDAVAPLATSVGEQSCLAVMKAGRLVVDDHATSPVLPASTTKLVTLATALDALGADYRFVTSAAGTVAGDTVVGDLYLIGGGDPVLVSDGYETLGKYREDAGDHRRPDHERVAALRQHRQASQERRPASTATRSETGTYSSRWCASDGLPVP